MQKLLSIVVPSYNAEKYIKQNLNSLCLEDLSEYLEVIAVDDGSKDSTSEIIDKYAERFSDIIVPIHKENGGHGSGINAGIKHATGKYFKVIDADDWADPEELRKLIYFIKEIITKKSDEKSKEIDIIAGGFYWVYGHDDAAEKKVEFETPFDGVKYGYVYNFNEIADKAYIKMHSMTVRTELLKKHEIVIDEKCFYVDTEYIVYPIPFVETIVFLNDHLYRYSVSREGQSMSRKQLIKNKAQYDSVLFSLYHFYEDVLNMEELSYSKRLYIEHLIARVYASRVKILLWGEISSETRKELVEMENKLKKNYPGIYGANLNWALKAMRISGYALYYPAALFAKKGV